jgi:hypothetical protein
VRSLEKKEATLPLSDWMAAPEALKPSPLKEAVRTADLISAERNFMEVCVFARPLAELVAPPAMRHHAEMSSTVIQTWGCLIMPSRKVRGNFAERATSRTEDGDVLSNDRFGGKSIRQREGASAFLHRQGLTWADKARST